MKKTSIILSLLMLVNCVFSKNVIYGIIKDAESNEALPNANIYIEGTYIGTISNSNGNYSLEAPATPLNIIVSYIGYETSRIFVTQPGNNKLDIVLKPVILESESIIITANREDPAIGIMKKVIENKIRWKNKLKSYKAKAYTRVKVENEKSIVSISESISKLYWDVDKGSREQFIAKNSSRRMPYLTEMEVGSKNIINLYEDNVSFFNHNFIGPTHPEALDYYDFELSGVRFKDSTKVFDIKVMPKSKLQPLFFGRVSVLDQEFALIDIDLNTSEDISFSEMIKYFTANYKQQFSDFGRGFWLLIDSRARQTVEVDMGLLAFPKAFFNKISRISDYKINVHVSGDIAKIDTAKILQQDITNNLQAFEEFQKIPLTARETEAYIHPDTNMTLIKSFKPSGLMAPYIISKEDELEEALSEHSSYSPVISKAKYGFQGWYNRVEELNIGINFKYKFPHHYQVYLAAGYQTGMKRFYYESQLRYLFDKKEKNKYLFAGYYDKIDTRYSSDHYPQLFTSLLPLFGAYDYFDYYSNKKLYTGFKYCLANIYSDLILELKSEDNSSIIKKSNCNILNEDFRQRKNPAIDEGRLNSIKLSYTYDESYNLPEIAKLADEPGINKLELHIEHSSSEYLSSDFNFTQYGFMFDYTLKTFFKRRPDYNYLRTKFVVSTYTGDLPLQRFVTIDGNIFSYSPFGIFKTLPNKPLEGEKKLGFFWEYNFKSIPFELLGLTYFARNKYEFIIHGASGRTWITKNRLAEINQNYNPVYYDGYHNELGLSLKLKYKFLSVRLDGTRNFNNNNSYFGFSFHLIGLSF